MPNMDIFKIDFRINLLHWAEIVSEIKMPGLSLRQPVFMGK
jgi:hypothetical protein